MVETWSLLCEQSSRSDGIGAHLATLLRTEGFMDHSWALVCTEHAYDAVIWKDFDVTILYRPTQCNGRHISDCGTSNEWHNVQKLLSEEDHRRIRSVWRPTQGTYNDFWNYQWQKHGTCISTLAPTCPNQTDVKASIVHYMTRTMELFSQFDTYQVSMNK